MYHLLRRTLPWRESSRMKRNWKVFERGFFERRRGGERWVRRGRSFFLFSFQEGTIGARRTGARERGAGSVRRRWDGVGVDETEVEVENKRRKTIAPSTLFFFVFATASLALARSLAVSLFLRADEEHGLSSRREKRAKSRLVSSGAARSRREKAEKEMEPMPSSMEKMERGRERPSTTFIIFLEWHLKRSPSFSSCSSSSLPPSSSSPRPETGEYFTC